VLEVPLFKLERQSGSDTSVKENKLLILALGLSNGALARLSEPVLKNLMHFRQEGMVEINPN
jgi:hypothetical protein